VQALQNSPQALRGAITIGGSLVTGGATLRLHFSSGEAVFVDPQKTLIFIFEYKQRNDQALVLTQAIETNTTKVT
jgi:hypothetical protein